MSRLCPHESSTTDVILLGHSMGGILSAEVCLLAPYRPDDSRTYIHRILGTINFDVPFLGIHPGIIKAGLSSLFRSEKSPPRNPLTAEGNGSALLALPSHDPATPRPPSESPSASRPSLGGSSGSVSYFTSGSGANSGRSPLSTPINDPNFNPRFDNDVVQPMRKGWDNTIHFVSKHYGGLTKAARAAVEAHLEFGGTMADYNGLRARYRKFRPLEDVDDTKEVRQDEYRPQRRLRFVNYYTASTGRPKSRSRSRSPDGRGVGLDGADDAEELRGRLKAMDFSDVSLSTTSGSPHISPRISIKSTEGDVVHVPQKKDEPGPAGFDGAADEPDLAPASPRPISDDEDALDEATPTVGGSAPSVNPASTFARQNSFEQALHLPPLPALPAEPPAFDPTPYPDKDVCKLARDIHVREMRAYVQAVKDRDKAAAEREKLIAKKEKGKQKGLDSALKREKKARAKQDKQEEKEEREREREEAEAAAAAAAEEVADLAATDAQTPGASGAASRVSSKAATASSAAEAAKPPRDRKFCITPSKAADGARDPTWKRVYMEGMDEVGAHVGLFIEERPHYEWLVNQVGDQINEWVERDMRVREERRGRMP